MSNVIIAAGGILYRRVQQSQHTQHSTDFDSHTHSVTEAANASPSTSQPAHPSTFTALDDIEVCLVHRPKYNDWSWPKGKLDASESIYQAAVREIQEETGYPAALGAYIQSVEYSLTDEGKRGKKRIDPKSPRKIVHYWIARILEPQAAQLQKAVLGPVERGDDVDIVQWLPVQQARKKLTHIADVEVLASFVELVKQGALDAGALVLVRHGKAEGRKVWRGGDPDRPLTPKGAAASYAIARELACFGINHVVSSPWKRCMDTMAPFAWQTGQGVVSAPAMTEDAFAQNPETSWQYMQSIMEQCIAQHSVLALGMHRPVIGGMFEHLRNLCASKAVARALPAKTPYMPTGHAVVLTVVHTNSDPLIIDIQKVAPIVY